MTYSLKYSILLFLIILFLSLFSCEKTTVTEPIDKDTTAPVVSFTIKGGNEISGEATLFLDITDDSEIDSIFVVLDDSTIVTITSDFDSIKFDFSPFVIELTEEILPKQSVNQNTIDYERELSIKAIDKEGNIGISTKIYVVITEFPGWRKYYKINESLYPNCFLVDENNLIWIGYSQSGLEVYNPHNGNIRQPIIPSAFDYPQNIINDFELIEGSRIWIASEHQASEYHYDLDKWLQVVVPPENTTRADGDGNPLSTSNVVHAVAIDANYDLYIGTGYDDLFRYNGADFTRFKISGYRIFPMDIHPDGTVYYSTNWGPQSYMYNDVVYEYSNYPGDGAEVVSLCQDIVIDNTGNVWMDTGFIGFGAQPGCYIWDGTEWSTIFTNNVDDVIYPVICDDNGLIYTEVWSHSEQSNNGIATFDGTDWIYWKELNTPFNPSLIDGTKIPSIGTEYSFERLIGEAPNGDIWMVIDYTLWRYRPSLGGYP